MPWDASSFKKHNKGLSPQQASKAAATANSVLKRTGDEGQAVRVGNAAVKNAAGRRLIGKQSG